MLRVLAATATAFALLLVAASSASAATNITVVPGNVSTRNAGPPTFAPTGPDSLVGVDQINTQLTAGTSVTLNTSLVDNSEPGAISIQAPISSANATANLTLDADDPITQTAGGTITVAGNTDLETNTVDDVTLDAANNFNTVSAGNVAGLTLKDANGLTLGAVGANAGLDITAGGNVTQTGAAVVSGPTNFDVGATHDVTMNNAGNVFSGVGFTSVNNANVVDSGVMTLDASTVSGNLTVGAGGVIAQNGGTSVAAVGTTTLTAGSGNDITLADASNDFGGAVTVVSADNVSLRDANALSLGASTVSGNLGATTSGAITQTGALAVTGTTSLTAGSANDITLSNAANDFGGTVTVVSGKNVRFTDADALALGASTVSGALTANADGPVTQTAATTVVGPTDVTGSPVVLSQAANDFTGQVQITSQGGAAAALADANDLSLGLSSTTDGPFTVTAGDDLAVPVGASVQATGALRLIADNVNPAAPGIGTGGITVGAGAALSGGDPIRLYAARRGDNSIAANATFNGATFTPGTIFVDSAREQWGFYSPAGSSTAPFTFFYKDTDASLPTANITKPASGATYEQGSVVNAAYTCADGGGGSGVVSCTGTVAVGSPIDTATLGQKTFKVDAENGSGGQSTTTVSYTVVDTTKPTITLTAPADGASFTVGEHVAADYTCADTAPVTCVGTVANGAAIDTSAPGAKTFTVDATDGSDNASTATATYTVGLPPGDCALPLNGSDVADILNGTSTGDLINGLGGDDEITGAAGVDCLLGGDGNDVIRGNAGADNLSGGRGNDELRGGPDDDQLRGQSGDDLLYGGDGADDLRGGGGTNTYFGRKGADVIRARNGIAEDVHCGAGNDVAYVDSDDKTFGCDRLRPG